MRICLIDADSFSYLIGWNFRAKQDDDPITDNDDNKEQLVVGQVDAMVQSILLATEATHYLGALGHPSGRCFRHDTAKFKEYKGNRKPDHPDIARWKPVIKQRLLDHWGFVAVQELEADDIISLAARELTVQGHEVVIASIDKDLRQFPGKFYDYKKLEWGDVDQRQATWLFWYQMIVGDSGDGVAGIPRKGDKAAHAILDPLVDRDDYEEAMSGAVWKMYLDHFGDHYGKTIFTENKAVLGLMTKDHLFYEPGYLALSLVGVRERHSQPMTSSAFD